MPFFSLSTCLTREIVFVINFIRFAPAARRFVSIRTGRREMTRLLDKKRERNINRRVYDQREILLIIIVDIQFRD